MDDPNYLSLIAANRTQLVVGAVCVLTVDLSLVMVPVVIFPILKRQNYVLALGSIVFRLMFPLALLEMVLAIWLIVKGFSSYAITSMSEK
jgi:hypothetical protein